MYYKVDDCEFPSESTEKLGYFVGIAENVGHALTFKVLTNDTNKVIYRSRIRTARKVNEKNLRIDPEDVKSVPEVVKSKHEEDLTDGKTMPTFDPSDLIGRTFLKSPEEDGQRYRGKILEVLAKDNQKLHDHPERIKFRCSLNNDEFEEVLLYGEILNLIEKDETDHGVWKFKSISGHQGPLSKGDKDYKGSRYNVLVNWETGERTYEPLNLIAADDPV